MLRKKGDGGGTHLFLAVKSMVLSPLSQEPTSQWQGLLSRLPRIPGCLSLHSLILYEMFELNKAILVFILRS